MGSPGSFLKKISNFVLFILNSSFPTQNFSILSSFFLQLPFSDYMSHFICICNDGYYGDGHSFSDINECKVGSHDCSNNADCININGGSEYGTHEGYRVNSRIVFDIDECADGDDACDINAECQNTNGSYTCTCDHGYNLIPEMIIVTRLFYTVTLLVVTNVLVMVSKVPDVDATCMISN